MNTDLGSPDHHEEVCDLWIVGYSGKVSAVKFFREVGFYQGDSFSAEGPIRAVGIQEALDIIFGIPFCYARTILKHPSEFSGMTCGPHHVGGSMMRIGEDGILEKLDTFGLKYEFRRRMVRVCSPWR